MGVLVCLLFHEGMYGVLERERERERHIYIGIYVTTVVVGFEYLGSKHPWKVGMTV